jgi:hypothetical protein
MDPDGTQKAVGSWLTERILAALTQAEVATSPNPLDF